jgi:ferric-dicitrate binding protein FerR (iron transport regulator)
VNDDRLQELLSGAGRPPAVSESDVAGAREAAREVFRARYGRRRARWMLPLAAMLAIAAALSWWMLREEPARPMFVATVDEQAVKAGEPIDTGSSSVWLRMNGGQSVRIAAHTSVVIESSTLVRLKWGTVAVDSQAGAPLTVRTPRGDFRPVGTRFEVEVSRDGVVRLRVEEGRVAFRSDIVEAGGELIARPDGTVQRDIAEIEGQSLHSVLTSMAAANDWELRYATSDAASFAATVVLHGSIRGMTPRQALDTITLSSGFEYELRDRRLTVRSSATPR